MESNIINQFLSTIRQLSIYDISQLARNLITELMERSEHHLYSESIKKEAYSELMLIKSILFHFDIKVTKQNINAANYTPNRGNQLSIGILVQKLPDFDIKECEIYKKFIKEFWIRCHCTKHCPAKVPFDNALKLYKEYYDLSEDIKCQRVGAILKALNVIQRIEESQVKEIPTIIKFQM